MAQGVTARVFRCFCDCSELTEKEIQDIVMGHTDLVFRDAKVKQLFRAFMDKFHPTPRHKEAMCLKYINCYEMSQELLSLDPSTRINYDKAEELYSNCPSYKWEKMLNQAIEDEENPERLEDTLHEFMQEIKMRFEDERHNYYGLFKEELSKKLGQK